MDDALLSPLLPTPLQTLFLRVCVQHERDVPGAWLRWEAAATEDGTSLAEALEPFKLFLPLLSWTLARAGIALRDERALARLHEARQAETLHWLRYQLDCHAAFATLSDAGIPFIALKGAALAESIYPSPSLRPKADIDVLLRPADLERAAKRFTEVGWRQMEAPAIQSTQHLPALVRRGTYPVELHGRLLIPYYALPYDLLWERSMPAMVAGVATRVLSDADALLHALAHAMTGYGLPVLPWVVDARFILERTASFDWPTFVETTRSARLSLPIHAALRYLVDELGFDVPANVMEELRITATRAGMRARAAARLGARPWAEGSVDVIWQTHHHWRRRVACLAQRVFPPPMQFALRYDLPLWALPYYYVVRIVKYARAHRAPRLHALP